MKLRKVKKSNGEIITINLVWTLQQLNAEGKAKAEACESSRALADKSVHVLDTRKAPYEGQKLWHLDPLRLSLRHPQYVQRVSGDVEDRGGGCSLPRYGRKT